MPPRARHDLGSATARGMLTAVDAVCGSIPLAALLAGTLATSTVAAAPAGDYQRYAAELERAEDAAADSDGRTALLAYAAAYRALPESDRLGDLGGDVIERVMEIGRLTLAATPADKVMLEHARSLLIRYLDEVAAADPSRDVAAAQRLRAEIEGVLGIDTAPPPPPPVGLEPEAAPPPEPAPVGDRTRSRRRLALGLTIGGASAAVTGIGLLGFGGWFAGRNTQLDAQYARDHAAGMITDAERESARQYLRDEQRVATGWLVGGAVVLTAGVGLLVGGIVVLVRQRSASQASARVAPLAGPRAAGLALHGRF